MSAKHSSIPTVTVQTGLITSVWAIVDLIVFLSIVRARLYPGRPSLILLLQPTGIHLIFNFPLSKLYSTSLQFHAVVWQVCSLRVTVRQLASQQPEQPPGLEDERR